MTQCLRCGQCCMTSVLVLDSVEWEKDDKELGKWLVLHRCDIEPIGDKLGVRIPLTCSQLYFEPTSNIAFCRRYEHRPKICREYFCQKARAKSIVFTLNEDPEIVPDT